MPNLLASLLFACGVVFNPAASPPIVDVNFTRFSAREAWAGLSDEDLIARTILAEAGGLVLDPRRQVDAYGVGWVVINRLRDERFAYGQGEAYHIVTAPGQFHAMESIGNAARAADPEYYSDWFGSGRAAYWTARAMAHCALSGLVFDPTRGALFFASARYKLDEFGEIALGENGQKLTAPYPDGRLRFRREFSDASYALPRNGWAVVLDEFDESVYAGRR